MRKPKAMPSWLNYRPAGRSLDAEVFPFDDLRHRGISTQIRAAHRYTFYMLVCVTAGRVTQLVDFEPIACQSGSLLVVRPGQVHSFGSDTGWEGWLVLFRAEFLPSASNTTSSLIPVLGLDRLPDHLVLADPEFGRVTEVLARMAEDVKSGVGSGDLHALMRFQLCVLLLRLTILHERITANLVSASRAIKRFSKFRDLLEENHARWHQVSDYATAIGCTEKSLTRSTQEAVGRSAKDVIAARIVLEAKRFLAHSDLAVNLIATNLGFDEATNFSKFFRRETGCTPGAFRVRENVMGD